MTKYDLCPYCFKQSVETIIINLDNLVGMARCTSCFKKMRLPDYWNMKKAAQIMRGGRL